MFVPIPILAAIGAALLLLLFSAFRRRRETAESLIAAHPRLHFAPVTLPPDLEREVRRLIDRGGKVEAIRMLRRKAALDVRSSKEVADRMEQEW